MQNTEQQFAVQQKCIGALFYLKTIRCHFLYLVYFIKVAQSANQPTSAAADNYSCQINKGCSNSNGVRIVSAVLYGVLM